MSIVAAKRALFALLLSSAIAAPSAAQDVSAVALRPIDRATVRIVSVRGLDIRAVQGRRTRVARVLANPLTSHGSGVAITPELVLTARHVVWGADAWAVFPPGASTPIAARPVYVDPVHDIAFLHVDRALSHHVPLPEARQLTMSERVSVSGYPLDVREPIPAAASGEVSRVTRLGELHLTMSVNPGHSGGPVIDGEGRIVGIVSARGRPERGVEGLVIAVTLPNVLAARAHVPSERLRFGEADRDLAQAIALLISEDDLADQMNAIGPIVQRMAARQDVDANRDVLVAGLAWNTLLELLEARSARAPEQLPPADQQTGRFLHQSARLLATRALHQGPHIRRRFPIVRAIALGHLDTEAQRPAPFR